MDIFEDLRLTSEQAEAFRGLLGYAVEVERAARKTGRVSLMMEARVKIDTARKTIGLKPMFEPSPVHSKVAAVRLAVTQTYRYVYQEAGADGAEIFVVTNFERTGTPIRKAW